MKYLIKLFATVLFLTMGAAHAQYYSPECEKHTRKQPQNECYTKAWRSIYNQEVLMFYAGAYDPQWWPSNKVITFIRSRQLNIPNLFNEACKHQPKCVFDLVVQESEAIAEKISRYKTGQTNYRKEVTGHYEKDSPFSIHSDSEFMVSRFGLSDPSSPPDWYVQTKAALEEPTPEQTSKGGYVLSETERKLGYTLDDIPEANSEEWEGD